MAQLPFRQPYRQQSRQMSTDPHNELKVHVDHYIGIDVGTGSARACIINDKGDIVGLASENIGLWQPEHGYYVWLPYLAGKVCRLVDSSRNNPQTTSGGASVPRCNEP
jgi:hypothetical protein